MVLTQKRLDCCWTMGSNVSNHVTVRFSWCWCYKGKLFKKIKETATDIDLSQRACHAWCINRQVPRFNLWVSKSPLRKPYRASQHSVLTHHNLSSGKFVIFFFPFCHHQRWICRSTENDNMRGKARKTAFLFPWSLISEEKKKSYS